MTEAAQSHEGGTGENVENDVKSPPVADRPSPESSDAELDGSDIGEASPDSELAIEQPEEGDREAADETDTETEDEGDFWIASRGTSNDEGHPQEIPKEENGIGQGRQRSSSATIKEIASKLKNVIVTEAHGFAKDSYELAVGIKEGMEITVEETLSLKDKLVSSTSASIAARGDGIIGLLSGRRTSSLSNLTDRDQSMSPTRGRCPSPTVGDAEAAVASPRLSENPLHALSRGLRANLGLSQEQQDADLALAMALQEGSLEEVPAKELSLAKDSLADLNVATDATDQMLQSIHAAQGDPISPSTYKPAWASAVNDFQPDTSKGDAPPTDALERLLSGDDDEPTKEYAKKSTATRKAQLASASVAQAASVSVAKVGQFARSLARFAPTRRTAAPCKVSSSSSNSLPKEQTAAESRDDPRGVSRPQVDTVEAAESDVSLQPSISRNSSSGNLTNVIGALKESSKAVSSGILRQASGLSGKLAAATRSRPRDPEKAKDETHSRNHVNSNGDDAEDSIFAICSDEDDDMFADEAFQTNAGISNGISEADKRASADVKEFEELKESWPSNSVTSKEQEVAAVDIDEGYIEEPRSEAESSDVETEATKPECQEA